MSTPGSSPGPASNVLCVFRALYHLSEPQFLYLGNGAALGVHQAAPSPLRGTLPPPGGQDATLPQVPWWVRSGTLVWGAPQAQLHGQPTIQAPPTPH